MLFWNQVPKRRYGALTGVSVPILQTMRSEMLSEVMEVDIDSRPTAAKRNGLLRVEAALRAKGYPVNSDTWMLEDVAHG